MRSIVHLFRKPVLLAVVILPFAPVSRATSPLESSWLTDSGAKYARIYQTQADALAGSSVSVFPPIGGNVIYGGQAIPAYAGIQSIRVSTNYVYVKSSALASYVMGPWYFNPEKTSLFLAWPSKQNLLARLPRVPPVSGNPMQKRTALGPIALWVDGTIIHNQLDAFYWNGSADDNTERVFTQSWQRNARYAEGFTFDPSGSHQPFTGERHHHISPSALRHALGDHVNYNPSTHTYSEATTTPLHSPILGWSFDGYPIYGPYGYANPNDVTSAVRRMVSGYVPRDGSYGTTNLNVTGRPTYPKWALDIGKPNSVNGPNVSTSFPLGWYVQDFDHLADQGYVQGTGFDLDRYNGRMCKTPEFPNGTYAYFIAINADGTPAFPYIIGLQYRGWRNGGDYGNPASVGFTSVETPNVTTYLGGPNAPLSASAPSSAGATPGTVTLTWSSVEGGRYSIETSTNLTNWTTETTNIRAVGVSTQQPAGATGTKGFYRVRFDSLDTYDPVTTQ